MKSLPSFIEDSPFCKMITMGSDSRGQIFTSVTSQHLQTKTRRRLARILNNKKKLQRQA